METNKGKKNLIIFSFLLVVFLCLINCRKQEKGTSVIYDLIEDFEVAELIQETEEIDFRDDNSRNYLLKGWSEIEKGGTWADSLSSELKFFTFFPEKNKRIVLKCFPYTYPNSPRQSLTLHLNGNQLTSSEISKTKDRYFFLLPAQYLKKGENILTFEFGYAKSPADILGKKDTRNLAARFDFLQFTNKKTNTKHIYKKDEIIFFNPLSSLNYYYKVPEEAHLLFDFDTQQSKISNTAKGLKLGIFVTEYRGEGEKIFEVPIDSLSSEKTSYDIDLSDFKEKIVRLSFRIDFPETIAEWEIFNFYGKLSKPRIESKKRLEIKEADILELLGEHKGIEKTNLIIAVLDAVNYRHMGCYGYERDTTPFIDRIADESFLFTNAYAQASWTLPSISSFFTSTYPLTHKVWSLERKLSDEAFTLAEALQKKGFETCAISATASSSSVFNLFQGFDEKIELYDEDKENLRSRYRKHVVWAEDFLKPGLEWVRKHKDEQFFLYLHYLQPHEPYNPPAPFRDEFGSSYRSSLKEAIHLTPSFLEAERFSREDLEYLKAAYDENLKYVDFYLDKFLQGLRDLGIYENTILVITADHGEAFLEHDSIGHSHTLFDEEIRIPLIIRFPEKYSLGEKKLDALVQSIDLMPTFMDVYGQEKKRQDMQGKSLLPLFFGKKKEICEFVLSSLSKPFVEEETRALALVDQRYKLIISKSDKTLFDLESDPGEKENIYYERPLLSSFYEQKLSKLRKEYMMKKGLALKGKFILDRKTRERLKALGYIK